MVRAAAKNFRDVLVVVSPDVTPGARRARRAGGPCSAFRFNLARTAFAHTAAYDTAHRATLEDDQLTAGGARVRELDRPSRASRS